jgi:hypothetical protein
MVQFSSRLDASFAADAHRKQREAAQGADE